MRQHGEQRRIWLRQHDVHGARILGPDLPDDSRLPAQERAATIASAGACGWPGKISRWRLSTTCCADNGVPSWKLTPASAGTTTTGRPWTPTIAPRVPARRRCCPRVYCTSVSKTWRAMRGTDPRAAVAGSSSAGTGHADAQHAGSGRSPGEAAPTTSDRCRPRRPRAQRAWHCYTTEPTVAWRRRSRAACDRGLAIRRAWTRQSLEDAARARALLLTASICRKVHSMQRRAGTELALSMRLDATGRTSRYGSAAAEPTR